MNSSQLGTATFVLGALGISFAACATSSDSTGSAGASSTAAGSGVGGGSAGSIGVAGSLISAGSPGFAGSTSFGGSPGAAGAATGTAGAGTGTAGAATGTGGAAAMSCGTLTQAPGDVKCCVAAGTATDLAIDDLEDKDNVILPLGQRQGYWYKYGTDSAQTPAGTMFLPGPGGHACSLTPAPPACAGTAGGVLYSSHTSGSLMPATDTIPTYAGIGFDFNNHFAKSCAYGASAYKGISFWAKGTGAFHAAVAIPGTTPTTADGGTCVPVGTKSCADNYFTLVAPVPDNATWKQFTITFSDTATFAQAGWGVVAPFDPAHILNLQFQVNGETTATAPAPYDFSIDDVAFVP
jgi:hypothetical protein